MSTYAVLGLRGLRVGIVSDTESPALLLTDGVTTVELSTGLPGATGEAALSALHLAVSAMQFGELIRYAAGLR